MCLDSLADFEVPDPGVGWKTFIVKDEWPKEGPASDSPHILPWVRGDIYSVFYEWLDEKDFREEGYKEEECLYTNTCFVGNHFYPFGFHIFLNKEDTLYSINAVVLPVRFRHVVATGYQDGKKVVVAKEMMILVEEP